MPRSALKPVGNTSRKARASANVPLTTSRPELLRGGRDREFRHLVHGLFGFAAHHERIRTGHARVIGLAGIEYTVICGEGAVRHILMETGLDGVLPVVSPHGAVPRSDSPV